MGARFRLLLGGSLVWRIYAYAIVLSVIVMLSVFVVGRALASFGDETGLNPMNTIRLSIADDLAVRLERAMAEHVAMPAEQAEIQRIYPHRIFQIVPWSQSGAYPAELARKKELIQPGPFLAPWQDACWVRLDVGGRPAGALRVMFNHDHARLHPKLLALAGTMLLVHGLMTLPPLVIWVIRPLSRMAAVAHRLGEGDLETPVPVDRKDEFGDLERAFESMRQRIQAMLAARERLLRDISHELRGPLSRMSIAVPLLRDELPDSPYLTQIERDMQGMDALIGEILALARGQSPLAREDQSLDLSEIAEGLLADRALVLKQKRLQVERQLDPAPAKGDRRLLARAMGNLLDNAIKYTPNGGQLTLETDQQGDHSLYRVIDSGPGIAPEHLSRLFEPFYRPDTSRTRETGGTGLGLSIVKAIAEGHHGSAAISSREGAGTTAEIRLPARRENA